MELNPGFYGKITGFRDRSVLPKIVNGVVTEFGFDAAGATDLSPVHLTGLPPVNIDPRNNAIGGSSGCQGCVVFFMAVGWVSADVSGMVKDFDLDSVKRVWLYAANAFGCPGVNGAISGGWSCLRFWIFCCLTLS